MIFGKDNGGADMPLTGPIPEGRTFFMRTGTLSFPSGESVHKGSNDTVG